MNLINKAVFLLCGAALFGLPLSATAEPAQIPKSKYYCDHAERLLYKESGMGMLTLTSFSDVYKEIKKQSKKLHKGVMTKKKHKQLAALGKVRAAVVECAFPPMTMGDPMGM